MAQKNLAYFTAKKIISPVQQTFNFPSGKDIGITFSEEVVWMADGNDTLFLTSNGWKITVQESFADVNTALSATNISGS